MDAAILLVASNESCPQVNCRHTRFLTKNNTISSPKLKSTWLPLIWWAWSISLSCKTKSIWFLAKRHRSTLGKSKSLSRELQPVSLRKLLFYAQLSFCSESSPIIPISAQLKYNIDALCDHLTNYIPLPIRDFTQSPKMVVIRSFDVNTPGSEVKLLSKALVGKSIGKLTTQNLGRSIARWCVRWFTYPRCSQARSGNWNTARCLKTRRR